MANTFASHLENINKSQINLETLEAMDQNMENLEIKLVTPEQIVEEIKKNINRGIAQGYDVITGKIKVTIWKSHI